MNAPLGGPLLASVSRSFYLTIRLLPAALRAPISVAYLLARASDTIADTTSAPVETRLGELAALRSALAGSDAPAFSTTPENPAERELLARLGECLAWLRTLDTADQRAVHDVLGKIIHGQELDLVRFRQPTALTAAELDEYTYLVAGCVGEFWTQLCLRHLPRYTALPEPEITRLGVNFGKGLQLVNILRDLPADLRAGRGYLPMADQPTFDHWSATASRHLADARLYIEHIRPWRLRQACILPWRLGVRTLELLRAHPPLATGERVKVPRSEVRRILLWSPFAALAPRRLIPRSP